MNEIHKASLFVAIWFGGGFAIMGLAFLESLRIYGIDTAIDQAVIGAIALTIFGLVIGDGLISAKED